VDKVEMLKALAKENSIWRLTTATARTIESQLAEDDSPIIVLPMRDVWIAGKRFRGMKPAVCLSKKSLLAVSRPGLLGRYICEKVDRDSIVSASAYGHRTFEIQLSDGREIKLRGMIGERRVDQMTERLYAEISSKTRRQSL
jgi:hypothetical protein